MKFDPSYPYVQVFHIPYAGADESTWTVIGRGRPHRSGKGMSIRLDGIPQNGNMKLRAYQEKPW